MTLAEWTNTIVEELKTAGFRCSVHKGFPLLKMPDKHWEIVRLLKFTSSLACDRRIYSEGMLFVPPGAWEAAQHHQDYPHGLTLCLATLLVVSRCDSS